MKLKLIGTNLIFSSSDNGTLSRAGLAGCLPDGAQNPSASSNCPNGKFCPLQGFIILQLLLLSDVDVLIVTSVGATQILPGEGRGGEGGGRCNRP